MHQDDLKPPRKAQGLGRGLETGHIAVVVGPPDVHHQVEALLELQQVVGHVRGEVGGGAVAAPHHPVLFVAELGGLEPQGAVGFIEEAALFQELEALFHQTLPVKLGFAEPVIEADPEVFQVLLDFGQDGVAGVAAQLPQVVLMGRHRRRGVALVQVLLGQLLHVAALVAVLGKFDDFALELPQAKIEGFAQGEDLVAHVVDVVFPHHLMAGGGEQVGQGVPQGGAAAVADVQGAGGVGADELHLDFLSGPEVAVAVGRAQLVNLRDHPVPEGVIDEKVDEAGAGDLHLGQHALGRGQTADQNFGHLPGRHLGRLGQDQGQVGGQVAVAGLLGGLHVEGGQGVIGELARGPGGFHRSSN